LPRIEPNHYATLGLHRQCTIEQIRAAYRMLAKQHHPDLNPDSPEAIARTQAIIAAHEILKDPERRRAYDHQLDTGKKWWRSPGRATIERNVSREIFLPLQDFLRGAKLQVHVSDPSNPDGQESYELVIPPETAPGKRIRLARSGHEEGGFVLVRLRPRANFRFKVRGSDLRIDRRIDTRRARLGGWEMVPSVTGDQLRVRIPSGIASGQILRLIGEGLPKPRGGRGNLLVRIQYRPEIRISRVSQGR